MKQITNNLVSGKQRKEAVASLSGLFHLPIEKQTLIQMKKIIYVALFLTAITIAGCQKNYYSGTGKGSNCGCPSHKGMSGY